MKSGYDFEVVCKNALIEVIKDKYGEQFSIEDIDFVWYNYTLGNYKALAIDKGCKEGSNHRYYECTYSRSADSVYVDIYEKKYNVALNGEQLDHVAKPRED